MTGDRLSMVLIAFYFVLAGVYGYEGQYWKVLYWLSAAGIVTAVWGMK
jgi:hypothetical protein